MSNRRVVSWALALVVALFTGSAAKTQEDTKPPTLAEFRRNRVEFRDVRNLWYSPDGTFILLQYDLDSLGIWDAKTGRFRVRLTRKVADRHWDCIAISPDGKKVAAIAMYFSDKMGRDLRIWDAATGNIVEDQTLPEWRTDKKGGGSPPFLKFSTDGALLYSIWDTQILEAKLGGKNRLLDPKLDDWRPERQSWDPAKVAFDVQTKLLILAHDNAGKPGAQLGLFQVGKEGAPQTIPFADPIASLALSADGKTLAVSLDGRYSGKPRLEFWDLATLKRRSFAVDSRKNFAYYHQLFFAPDGKMLAGVPFFTSFTGRTLDVLDLEGRILAGGPVSALTFSPDGKTLAGVHADSVVFVDPATGKRMPLPGELAKKDQPKRQVEKKPIIAKNEAEKLFRDMEKKITTAKAFEVRFTYKLEAKTTDGSLLVTNDNRGRLQVKGHFYFGVKDNTTFEVVSDGEQFKTKGASFASGANGQIYVARGEEGEGETPENWHALITAIFIREGMFAAIRGQPRGVRDAFDPDEFGITVCDFQADADEKVGERQAKVVRYRIGTETKADPYVTLWIDAETGLPLQRIVLFRPENEKILITETYNEVKLDPNIDVKAFELPR